MISVCIYFHVGHVVYIGSVWTVVLADRCHVYERFVYCTLLSERHVVFLSALSVMYILLMYYISLLLLPPDGSVLCYIGLLVLTLWRFDDDVISPSPGKGRHRGGLSCDWDCWGAAQSPSISQAQPWS